jgi:hypothetical protein
LLTKAVPEIGRPNYLPQPADGAFGRHPQAVQTCHGDFKALMLRIMERCDSADLHTAP